MLTLYYKSMITYKNVELLHSVLVIGKNMGFGLLEYCNTTNNYYFEHLFANYLLLTVFK